jgi:Aconitase family (aconitate hydratase)
MPLIWGIKLIGKLPNWVSAKDIVLEMLRRHSVDGGVGRIVEYYGPGLPCLSAMDRHVIANMGAELGATTTVFPSDNEVRPKAVPQLPALHECFVNGALLREMPMETVVGARGFEPRTSCAQGRRATRLRYAPT